MGARNPPPDLDVAASSTNIHGFSSSRRLLAMPYQPIEGSTSEAYEYSESEEEDALNDRYPTYFREDAEDY